LLYVTTVITFQNFTFFSQLRTFCVHLRKKNRILPCTAFSNWFL